MTVLDDTYDAYGTYEDLVIFSEAIQRWSITCLPTYLCDHADTYEVRVIISTFSPLYLNSLIKLIKELVNELQVVYYMLR